VEQDSVELAGGRRLFTEDPFGNRIGLTQPNGEEAR
jgi:predicted enzyme related to lactoylglutathione lyase